MSIGGSIRGEVKYLSFTPTERRLTRVSDGAIVLSAPVYATLTVLNDSLTGLEVQLADATELTAAHPWWWQAEEITAFSRQRFIIRPDAGVYQYANLRRAS